MEDALLAEVNSRLSTAEDLDPRTRELTLAAVLGELEACLSGQTSAPPPATTAIKATKTRRSYVGSIAVEGFRGIGPLARLELTPGPGLTLVVGRNGSGKSSFAEALELLLTGDNQRWSTRRHKVWQDGWRNLHHADGVSITAEMVIEGTGPTQIQRTWNGDNLADGTTVLLQSSPPGGHLHGEHLHSGSLDDLGWSEALATCRPFLSYNELGAMLEEGPSRLYDALASILGLDELVTATQAVAVARKAQEGRHKAVRTELTRLRENLAKLDDERAVQCLAGLKGTKWKLDAVEALITGEGLAPDSEVEQLTRLTEMAVPDPAEAEAAAKELRLAAREVSEVHGTDAEKARRLAGLLENALRFHDHAGDGDCPVCGRQGAIDPDWRGQTRASVDDLRAQADAAELAHRRLAEAERRARGLATEPPALLTRAPALGIESAVLAKTIWSTWRDLREQSRETLQAELPRRGRELAGAFDKVREEASEKILRLHDDWREIAIAIAGWLPGARDLLSKTETVRQLKKAEKWLKQATTDIRNDRFHPIKGEVLAYWERLRARSSVELADVKFEGTATRRRINLDVTVDGIEGAALGVMSQGELHALALALFLPRATLEASPFHFLMIDDPVQAMDPARVDGLAHTLSDVAQGRQVIVFTHDNRLPEAVRRLEIEADIFEIQRRPNSVVEVRRVRGPVERYFDDAHALARTDELPRVVVDRVVPGLCRQSLEAACLEVVRRRRLVRGDGHAGLEELIARNPRLVSRLALALFDDAERGGDVYSCLRQRYGAWAIDVVQACNKGAHGALLSRDETIDFVRQAEQLCRHLRDER